MAPPKTLADVWERSSLERLIRSCGAEDPDHVAARLLDEFGSAGAILAAVGDPRLVKTTCDIRIEEVLGATSQLISCVLGGEIRARVLLPNDLAVRDYLRATMAYSSRETLRILYLDAAHRLLSDEIASVGTVDCISFHVREIVRRALEVGAVGIILAHNHPSGDPAMTNGDVEATKQLASTCRLVGVRVLDHLIVATGGISSMHQAGVLR